MKSVPMPSDESPPTQLSLFDAEPGWAGAQEPAPAPLPPSFPAHPQAQRHVVLDGHRVAYALRRARRRSIGFVVGTEGLSVSAPRWLG
jgi:hypothetical protein